jgi:catechol 2,3-dioxygenase-like lactoylglutathione lyase family enzyme
MIGKWQALVIDCEDPDKLAGFYQGLLGMIRVQEDAHWISIGDAADRPAVAFQRVDRLVRPQWPDAEHPQQMHVDVKVDDLDAGEAQILRLGATRLTGGTQSFRVYADPSGHPFCLVLS